MITETRDQGPAVGDQPLATYRLEERAGEQVIVCLVCGAVSYHPLDIRQLYCARCSVFHDDRVAAGWQQFLVGKEPMPAGVAVVWVDNYETDQVLCVHPEEPLQEGNMAFGVKTPAGWRVALHGDWIVTLLSTERVIDRDGVRLGLERSSAAG